MYTHCVIAGKITPVVLHDERIDLVVSSLFAKRVMAGDLL